MAQTLTLLTWPDYIDPQTLQQFEIGVWNQCATGIRSKRGGIDRTDADSTSGSGCVGPSQLRRVRELKSQSRLLKLDHMQLPNLEHLEPRFYHGRAHDPESLVERGKRLGDDRFYVSYGFDQ